VSCDVTLRMMGDHHRQDQARTACISGDAAVTHSAQRPPVAVQLLICPGTAPTVAAQSMQAPDGPQPAYMPQWIHKLHCRERKPTVNC